MIKTRGRNRKSTKNADLNLEQDNEPAKLAGVLAELAEELAEPTGDRVKAKLATQSSQERGKKHNNPQKTWQTWKQSYRRYEIYLLIF